MPRARAPRVSRPATWDAVRRRLGGGYAAIALLLIAVGVALRLAVYVHGRPLWLDEALIVINLLDPPPEGLLGPLSFAQGAPPGFLLAQSWIVDAIGPGEHALRLLPFAAGVGALVLFWPVARRIVPAPVALWALALFAVLAPLLDYSSQAKQYSSDVLAALAVTGVALLLLERPRDMRIAFAAGLVGGLALWLSHAALLVMVGVGAVLAIHAVRQREAAAIRVLAGAVGIWVASAAAAYAVSLRHLGGLQQQVVGGDSPFSPRIPPRELSDLVWPADISATTLEDLVGWPAPLAAVAALLVLAGAVSLLRRDAVRGWLLLAPAAVVLIAAALERYPFGDRFVLFLMPALAILAAEGSFWLRDVVVARRPPSTRRFVLGGVALAPLAALVGWQLSLAGNELASPRLREDIRPALLELTESWRPGDQLYVSHGAQYALRYYAESGWIAGESGRPAPWSLRAAPPDPGPAAPALLGDPPSLVIGRSVRGGYRPGIDADLETLAGHGRTWVLISHAIHGDWEFLHARFDDTGRRLRSSFHEGVALHLYDLRSSAR